MVKGIAGIGVATTLLALGFGPAAAQAPEPLHRPASGQGTIFVPPSSLPSPNDAGVSVHTHVRAFVPEQAVNPNSAPASGYYFETPASLACVYGQVTATAGCVPGAAKTLASGGSKLVAIVDAYDDPNVAADLATYSAQWGLPAAKFSVVYAGGTRPPQDASGGWALETALDVEMVHALAPGATIVLVEAASAATMDLLRAVDVAGALVAKAGGGEVSMSWGSSEFAAQTAYDVHFATPGVVYLAASGDAPGVGWPATSANVVSVGGTSVSRNPTSGALIGEATWTEGGGGPSLFVPAPAYQGGVAALTGTKRATPDIAAIADPDTPVMVYDSVPLSGAAPGWVGVGGTSVATPVVAAIINAAGTFRASSAAQLTQLYAKTGTTALNAISRGICGPYAGYSPGGAWNPCVGVGSPIGKTAF